MQTLIDTLLPPVDGVVASAAIPADGLDLEAEETEHWTGVSRDLARLADDAREARLAAVEAAEPQRFRRLMTALYVAYYSTAETADRIRRLAERSPREASPHFDPALLAGVVRRQLGRRRL